MSSLGGPTFRTKKNIYDSNKPLHIKTTSTFIQLGVPLCMDHPSFQYLPHRPYTLNWMNLDMINFLCQIFLIKLPMLNSLAWDSFKFPYLVFAQNYVNIIILSCIFSVKCKIFVSFLTHLLDNGTQKKAAQIKYLHEGI